ncbi:hypothetical protein LXL04_032641 [Taraxacum kok-saghyz]
MREGVKQHKDEVPALPDGGEIREEECTSHLREGVALFISNNLSFVNTYARLNLDLLAIDCSHWMYRLKRLYNEYLAHLEVYEEICVKNEENYIWCHCRDYGISQKKECVIVEDHLIRRGFMHGYTCWARHWETLVDCAEVVLKLNKDCEDDVTEENDEIFQYLFDY